MQVRVGEKRCFRVVGKLSRATLASLSHSLVFAGLFFFCSCSIFSPQVRTTADLKRVCLSAEGKGRLEHSRGRHLFEFESLLVKKEKKWSLGLDLPVIGQEVLHFSYPDLRSSKTIVSGTFATRLKLDIKSAKQRQDLNRFFLMMGELLSIIDSGKIRDSWKFESEAGRLVLNKDLVSGEAFTFEAFAAEDYYEKMSLSLEKKDKFGKLFPVMKMNLFLSQCAQP